ncbi:MAG: NUDIX domain-containing protein [Candidatus Woesearchaeota archaeon]
MPQERSAGAVIFRKERGGSGKPERVLYLLLHYESGHWDFVKGKIEGGETEKETVMRESEEEAGIKDLRFIEGFSEKVAYSYRERGRTVHKEVTFFLAETSTADVRLSHEHQDYAWLGYEDAAERLTFSNAEKVIEKADSFLNGHLKKDKK